MKRWMFTVVLFGVALPGCAPQQASISAATLPADARPDQSPQQASISTGALPAGARPDLNRQRWLTKPGFNWPPNNGFAGAPALEVLPPGILLDRFGTDDGNFFSPAGAAYSERALPYVCLQQAYTVFRVKAPLAVWAGRAAPWFDQPGGATQFETDANAARLIQDSVIVPTSRDAPGVEAPDRPCDRPPR